MMTLHGYWRSSASYRVRIALALKGIDVNHHAVNLKEGEQLNPDHRDLNAQPFVPILELEDGTKLTQSLAILDYLDAAFPKPSLMPKDAVLRSKILSASLIVASDIAPIQNLSVLKYIRLEHGQEDDGVKRWVAHWIERGFQALEIIAGQSDTQYLMTEEPGFFECCLIPQIYNANRFGVDMTQFPKLTQINEICLEQDAFQIACPENQPDAL